MNINIGNIEFIIPEVDNIIYNTSTKLLYNGSLSSLLDKLLEGLDSMDCTFEISAKGMIFIRSFTFYTFITGGLYIYYQEPNMFYLVYKVCKGNYVIGSKLFYLIINASKLAIFSVSNIFNNVQWMNGPDAYYKYIKDLQSYNCEIQERGAKGLARLEFRIKIGNIDIIMNRFKEHCYMINEISKAITMCLSIVICNLFYIIKRNNSFNYEHFVKMGIVLDPLLYRCERVIDIELARTCIKALTSLCVTHDSFKIVIGDKVKKYAKDYLNNRYLYNTASDVLDRL